MKKLKIIPAWLLNLVFALLVCLLLALNGLLALRALAPQPAPAPAVATQPADQPAETPPAPPTPLEQPRPNHVLDWSFLGIGLVASILLLVIFFQAIRIAKAARCTAASNEMLDTAEWMLRHVFKDNQTISVTDAGTLQKRIEEWYFNREKDVLRMVDERTAEWTKELRMATDFQLAMMQRPYPVIPEIHITERLRLNFFHRYQAASGLGGDFFDILKVDRDVGGIFIADVMGHGTRSALITSILRTLMADALHVGRNAPHFLAQVNKNFCDILKTVPDLVFASALYFVADTTGRVATYASAGHPAPIHIRRNVNRVEFAKLPTPRSAALGILPDEEFPGATIRLAPEDVFIFYTDGLTEAFSPEGEEFGEDRVKLVIERCMYSDIKTIVNTLYDSVLKWAAGKPMADDVCLIAVESTIKRPPKEGEAT